MKRTALFIVIAAIALSAVAVKKYISRITLSADNVFPGFEHIIIDADGPVDPWGKSVGDIDGDGKVDLIVGGHKSGGLVWYQNPTWKKHVIEAEGRYGTDHEVADIDGDGKNDVISLADSQLVWFKNGSWAATVVDQRRLHDVEAADLDADGDVDIVARNQGAFGKGGGDKIYLYRQESPNNWSKATINCPDGEGLKLADINGDKKPDIIINGLWYENAGGALRGWEKRRYTTTWTWPHGFIAVEDINQDKRPDIVVSPAEHEGEHYRISWFEAPVDAREPWTEHIVQKNVEAVHHFVGAADMDNDGDLDIVSAEMHQGKNPDEVKIFLAQPGGDSWRKYVIADKGSHSLRLLDIDSDGDMDLFGANWSGRHQAVELWKNRSCDMPSRRWRRHVVDKKKPWRSVFITAADINMDGYQDIVTGGWWYANPGVKDKAWKRIALGAGANNMAVVYDFDGDGDADVLATQGKGSRKNARFVWAENTGKGEFIIHENVEQGYGDFLQGAVVGGDAKTGGLFVALSWHAPNKGIQLLTVPADPKKDKWSWRRIAQVSQDEQLSLGDIDRDGDEDLLLGTLWLKNAASQWEPYRLTDNKENPDRNRLVDINGDGRLDAVVGYEAISKAGDVVWYEQGADPAAQWKPRKIATVVGPMSLDVADMDGDGDNDVVVGEHNLAEPESARLFVFENTGGVGKVWTPQQVYTGDEHHDGAQAVDIDADGDLDIISIGWGHDHVLLYENLSRKCKVKH